MANPDKKNAGSVSIPEAPGAAGKVGADAPTDNAAELKAALNANKMLSNQLLKAEDENENLKKEVTRLAEETVNNMAHLSAQAEELAAVTSDLHVAKETIEKLNKKLSAGAAGLPDYDCAVLGGQVFKVTGRHMAKWLNTEVLRRHIEEDKTVVVLDRVGD